MALEKSSGRGVTNSYGARTATPFTKNYFKANEIFDSRTPPFNFNQLVLTQPTRRCIPFDRDGTAGYTSQSVSGGTIAVDYDRTDHTTGLPMAKVSIPAANTSYQGLNYYDMTPWSLNSNDVYLVSVYFPDTPPSNFLIQIMVTDATSIAGVNYRIFEWNTGQGVLSKGYNTLACLQVEDKIEATEYGHVGTGYNYEWTNTGSQTDTTQARSIRMRVRYSSAPATDTDMWIGSIHTAPEGWCKSAIIWSVDDAPVTFYNVALPIIESFGWKITFNVTTGYLADPSTTYMSTNQMRAALANGHEIWGHTRLHDNLDTSDFATKLTSLTAARDFWNSQGIYTAAKYMAYPQGGWDDETVTLLKSLGYRLASTVTGISNCPWTPAINPYHISRFSVERENSWYIDSVLNGSILRGQSIFTYMHNAIDGGSTSNTYPGAVSFYADHLQRWCELVAEYERAGKVVMCTGSEYYKLCGVDPLTDTFAE